MMRFLSEYSEWFGPLRVFDSITFRVLLGLVLAFGMSVVFGRWFVRFMQRRRMHEDVNKPDSATLHQLHSGKKGTPTMGGLMIVFAVVICALLLCDPTDTAFFRSGDLLQPQLFCQTVLQAERIEAPRPARQIWLSLSKEGQEAIRSIALVTPGQEPKAEDVNLLVKGLNRLLADPMFYQAEAFQSVQLEPSLNTYRDRRKEWLLDRHLHAFNRGLLDASFPNTFRLGGGMNQKLLLALGLVVCFGLIGLYDDWIKLRGLGKQGLSKKQKLICQFAVSGIVAFFFIQQIDPEVTRRLLIPFTKWSDVHPDLGWLYPVFFVVTIVACSNAVNLTDGLDGLASGCTILVCLTFAILAYVVGNAKMCLFFRIPYVAGSGELAILCAIMIGAVMGFLWFNAHPAQVFMGDTGSLALGAVIAYVALVIKHELVLVLAGGIFVIEALSVLIQVISFRTTGKRVFKCAPFHHHLEFCGWHENKVVMRLWIIGVLLAGLALGTLKMH